MDLSSLEKISSHEFQRFSQFLDSHSTKTFEAPDGPVTYSVSGAGEPPVLMFAGGWGGPELGYETILGIEGRNRVIVIDIGTINTPKMMAEITDRILEAEKIKDVILVGQSMSGILAQVFFRERRDRIRGMILTNTPAPRKKKARKWALVLLKLTPLSLFKKLAARALKRLSRTEKELSAETREILAFKRAFTSLMFQRYVTRKKFLAALHLAFALSDKGDYMEEELRDWAGTLFVITSDDEPYHRDVVLFQTFFPRCEVHKLPTGFGHIAPQVFREEFFDTIRTFLRQF